LHVIKQASIQFEERVTVDRLLIELDFHHFFKIYLFANFVRSLFLQNNDGLFEKSHGLQLIDYERAEKTPCVKIFLLVIADEKMENLGIPLLISLEIKLISVKRTQKSASLLLRKLFVGNVVGKAFQRFTQKVEHALSGFGHHA